MTGRLGRSPCSRNARSQTPLVGRAQLGSSQPPLKAIVTAALPGIRRVSARQGWAGEKSGLFEHLVVISDTVPWEISQRTLHKNELFRNQIGRMGRMHHSTEEGPLSYA